MFLASANCGLCLPTPQNVRCGVRVVNVICVGVGLVLMGVPLPALAQCDLCECGPCANGRAFAIGAAVLPVAAMMVSLRSVHRFRFASYSHVMPFFSLGAVQSTSCTMPCARGRRVIPTRAMQRKRALGMEPLKTSMASTFPAAVSKKSRCRRRWKWPTDARARARGRKNATQ